MNDTKAKPPAWAEALLQCLVGPCDRECAAGDLLEEYRAAREPTVGTLRADLWYIKQVLTILWRLIWPGALTLAIQSLFFAVTVFRPGHHAPHRAGVAPPTFLAFVFQILWYGSIVGAPGVSLVDGMIYFFTAYRGVRRTGLIRTGPLVAAATSLVGFGVLFAAAATITPGLAMATLAYPALFLIVSVYLAVPLTYSAALGTLAGIIGRSMHVRGGRIARSA